VTATEILGIAHQLGAELIPLEHDMIRCRFPRGTQTDELMGEIRRRKRRLLGILRRLPDLDIPSDDAELAGLIYETSARCGVRRELFEQFTQRVREELQGLEDQIAARAVIGDFTEAAMAVVEWEIAWREAAEMHLPTMPDNWCLGCDD
jgi:hypothetical protein